MNVLLGGKEEGKPGRSLGNKDAVLMMIEVRSHNKIGRVYAKKISNYKKETIYPIFEKRIKPDAKIVTDEFPTYDKLKEKFSSAKQLKSMKGANFLEMHQQIMNMKSGLRGIHHKCSRKHLQSYLDQYCFRTNRWSIAKPIVLNLISKCINGKVITYETLKADAV